MPKFTVTISHEAIFQIEVEAEDSDHAEELADDIYATSGWMNFTKLHYNWVVVADEKESE